MMKSPITNFCALAFAMAALVTPVMGKIVNLADQDFITNGGETIAQNTATYNNFTWHGSIINGAMFRRAEASDDLNSGSGVFRDLYSSQDSPIEIGYNRPKSNDRPDMDSSVLGGTSHLLTVGDLKTGATDGFYVFTIDANEKNNAIERFVSLDKFQLFVEVDDGSGANTDATNNGYTTDPDVLPGTEAGMSQLGDKIYDMDIGADGDSTVLMDYSTSNGSGTFDTFVFIPTSLFDGYDDAAYIYLFTQFGAYADSPTSFIADAGGEQIAAYTDIDGTDPDPPVLGIPPTVIPEPHSAMLASIGAMLLAFRRRRVMS